MQSPSEKRDYRPLLDVGFHPMTLAELRKFCVDHEKLQPSATRNGIMTGLEDVFARLTRDGVVGDAWVDGSFLTEKIDADDSDVVLRVSGEFYDSGSAQQQSAIDWFDDEDLKPEFKCHSFVYFHYPTGHAEHALGVWMNAYWLKQWGFSRGGAMKGIAVIKLPP